VSDVAASVSPLDFCDILQFDGFPGACVAQVARNEGFGSAVRSLQVVIGGVEVGEVVF